MDRLRLRWAMFRSEAPRRLWTWLAWQTPRPLAYWCAIRVAVQTIPGDQEVPAYTVADALQRWDREVTS